MSKYADDYPSRVIKLRGIIRRSKVFLAYIRGMEQPESKRVTEDLDEIVDNIIDMDENPEPDT